MTDLISKLADDIHELINASPRSPRKEEIEQTIKRNIGFATAHTHDWDLHTFICRSDGGLTIKATCKDCSEKYAVTRQPAICDKNPYTDLNWRPIEGTRTAECICGCGAMRYY